MSRLSKMRETPFYLAGWHLVGADNARVTLQDARGRRREVIDLMAGYGAVNFGHRNRSIESLARTDVDLMPGVYAQNAETFADWLCDHLRLPDHKVLFQVGGSFAVSSALALAQRQRPGRILSVERAFHGLGLDSLSLAPGQEKGTLFDTALLRAFAGHVDTIEPPRLPATWSEYSCFIYETIQGSAGHIPLPVEWLAEMETQARRAGVTVIADEILCGYFRHGWLSPARHHGLAPDIVLFSKSMTNGLFPSSAVVYSAEIDGCLGDEICAEHTFQSCAFGSAAAMAVASFLDRTDMSPAIERLRSGFERVSCDVAHRTACTLSLRPSAPAEDVAARCFRDGVLVTVCGRDDEYVCLVPPLTIEPDRLDHALEIVTRHAR